MLTRMTGEAGGADALAGLPLARAMVEQARAGHAGMVAWLLAHGVDANVEARGRTALAAAALAREPEALGVLLAAGARVDGAGADGETPLVAATEAGNIGAVKRLIAAGAAKDATGPRGRGLMALAAGANAPEVIDFLAGAGLSPAGRDEDGADALGVALTARAGKAVQALVRLGARLEPGTEDFDLRVEQALGIDADELVGGLIGRGWSAEARLYGRWPVPWVAHRLGATRCEALLKNAGASESVVAETEAGIAPAVEASETPRLASSRWPRDPREAGTVYGPAAVVVSAVLDEEGRVRFPMGAADDGRELLATTLEALRTWRFTPPKHKGRTMAVKITLPVKFPSSAGAVFDGVRLDEVPVATEALSLPGPVEGGALVECVVDAKGAVGEVELVSASDPALAEPARRAVSAAKFLPGKRDGEAVRARVRVPVRFTLAGHE